MKKYCMLIPILLFSSAAFSYDKAGSYKPWGLGAAPCEVFLTHIKNDRDGKNELIYMQWFNGFYSGINAGKSGSKDFSAAIDRETLTQTVVKECQLNQKQQVEAVLVKLLNL